MINSILQNSINNSRFLQIKRKCDIEAILECKLWSDKKERNHLDFSERPEIPVYNKSPRIKLSVGAWNLCRQFLP